MTQFGLLSVTEDCSQKGKDQAEQICVSLRLLPLCASDGKTRSACLFKWEKECEKKDIKIVCSGECPCSDLKMKNVA